MADMATDNNTTIGNTNTGAHQTGATEGTGAPMGTDGANAPPNHLGTTVPSGHLNGNHDSEKLGHDEAHHEGLSGTHDEKMGVAAEEEDDNIEDIDALIDDLESQDGAADDEEEEATEQGGARPVSDEMLNTDTRTGLSEHEVTNRRKKYGLNQMKEEKENLILKFLGYFVGPIQFVMEVSADHSLAKHLSPQLVLI